MTKKLDPHALDFTEGGITKKMLIFAGPMFLGNVLQTSYQFIDSLWIGNLLGDEALGAHAISNPIIFAILSFIIGVNSATLTILGQQKGMKDEAGIKKSINAFVFILGILSIVLGIVGYVFSEALLKLLGTPPELLAQAKIYLQINFISIVFLFGYNFIGTVLRALGDSRTPVRFVMLAVVLNAGLDPLFIHVFKGGMAGAAYATVVAQGSAFLYGVIYSVWKRKIPFGKLKVPDREFTKMVLKLGLPGGLQMVAVSSGMVVIMSVVNSFGKDVVSGFGAAQRLESLIMIPALTLGSVVNTMSGQNIGAGHWHRVQQIAKVGALTIVILSLTIGVVVFFAAKQMIQWFITDPATVAFGEKYLKITAFFFPFLGLNFILNGIARSSGAMLQVLLLNIISFWVLRYPLTFLFSHWFGEIGIAYGMAASFVISSVIAVGYYYLGNWRKIKLFS